MVLKGKKRTQSNKDILLRQNGCKVIRVNHYFYEHESAHLFDNCSGVQPSAGGS